MLKKSILKIIEESISIQNSLKKDCAIIIQAVEIITRALREGNKIIVAGNGGSAADAQHFAAELEAKYFIDRPGLPAICLNCNSSTMTAWSNDVSFDSVFERQIEAHGKPGDVFIAISTSGGSSIQAHSKNILLAARKAKTMDIKVIGLSGKSGGALKDIADVCIIVNSFNTARIQECHITILHIISEFTERLLFDENSIRIP